MDYNAGAGLSADLAASQDALGKLQRLGGIAQADPILTEAESTNYDSIVNDASRSQAWIIQTCAVKYIGVVAALARKRTAAANSAGRQDASDAAAVYGIAGLPGDVASLAISRRDAADRVATISDRTQLQSLLAAATRSGDVVLAHAIAEAAITSGDVDTTNQFTDAYPNLADAVQRLWDGEQRRMSGADITTAWRVAALKPAPLKSLMDYEIASAAAGNA
jgi:hypothetical protein